MDTHQNLKQNQGLKLKEFRTGGLNINFKIIELIPTINHTIMD